MAEFWDTHDATDFESQTHEVRIDFDLPTRPNSIAIDPDLLARLRRLAQTRGINLESLVNLWLLERAFAAENHAGDLAEIRNA
jgi:hypothetical protein